MITTDRLYTVMMGSLFLEGEDTSSAVRADGITMRAGFHPERLETHRNEITDALRELPEAFQKTGGGGASFLEMCTTESGEIWTGDQRYMETLLVLGLGLGLVSYCAPRKLWQTLPQNMPYVVIDLPELETTS